MNLFFKTFVLLLALSATGCATKPPANDSIALAAYEEANDPIEPLNRYFFELSRFADFLLLDSLSKIYTTVVPKYPRQMLDNFYSNLREPIYLVNNYMQGNFKRGSTGVWRFMVNSSLGAAGFFDVADAWFDLKETPEDFGQTLAVYGIPEGPFLFIPLLGPSSFRDALGSGLEAAGDPFRYLTRIPALKQFRNRAEVILQMRGPLKGLEFRASSGKFLLQAERESIDFYARIRGLYRQNRKNAILNGELDFDSLPEIPDDDFFNTTPK